MDSWEWNKIAGAVLGTLLFVLVVKFVAQALYDAPPPKTPGYSAAQPAEAPAQPVTAADPLPDFAEVLPTADIGHGKEIATRCQQCHDESKGGPSKVGPNLWGVVNRPRAALPDFSYSPAMAASREPWSYDKLYLFLGAPQGEVPGTKMGFAGLHAPQDRIDLIAYLRSLADKPAPLPAKK